METQKLPIFQGIFATGLVSWMGWLSLAHMETDRTQDVVLERLRAVDADHIEMHRAIGAIPAKTSDRWHRSEEMIHQDSLKILHKGQDIRIDRLERFHEPYMWEKK